MATALKLKNDINKLKAALRSKATPKSFIPKLKSQLEKAEADYESVKAGKKSAPKASKQVKSTMDKLKAIIKKKKYGAYRAQGVDLKKDADRPALPTGKRISKNGNTYYEYRANRIDVKQPPKRYPKLEDGGMMAKGGDVDYFEQLKVYVQGVGEIYSGHSMKKATEKAESYLAKNPKAEVAIVDEKYGDEYDLEGNIKEYKKGGMMAKGGKTRQSFMMGDEEVYIVDSSIGLKDEVCLFYKKDDSILKCISQNQLKSFIEQGKLKPKMASGGMMADGGMMAKGGELKEDDFVWNEFGKKLVVDKVTDTEYFLKGFMQTSTSPFSKNKVDTYIKLGKWSLKPKMADGGVIYLESVGTYFRPSDLATSSEESFSNEGEIVDLADIDNEEWFNALSEKDRATIEKYKAKGGMMAKGGDLSSIKKKYEENEDENAHSENVVLLAKHFGTKEDLAKAKEILALHEKEGSLSSENGKKRQELHLKLIGKARAEMGKQGIEFEKGGYMAKGGDIGIELMGGQSNSELKPSGYKLISKKGNEIIVSDDGGQTKERYVKNKYGVSGYRLVYNGNDYEFTDSFKEGGYMADGGMTPLDVSNQIYDITVRIAELGNINTEAAYEETKNLMKMRAALQARALHLQDMEMAKGGELHRSQEKYAYGRYMAMGGAIEHGLKKGDHIMVVRGNMLGIKNEITGEIVTLNIETGERKESKE
jgi:hypothetical protein